MNQSILNLSVRYVYHIILRTLFPTFMRCIIELAHTWRIAAIFLRVQGQAVRKTASVFKNGNRCLCQKSFLDSVVRACIQLGLVVTLVSAQSCDNDAGFSGGGGEKVNTGNQADQVGAGKDLVEKNESRSEMSTGPDLIGEEVSVTVNTLSKGSGIADIVFIVDTSSSMDTERQKLQENMQKFLKDFGKDRGKIDYQVVMIGGSGFDFPIEAAGKSEVIAQDVGSKDGLEILKNFLLNPGLTTLALRPEAVTEIIFVTDANSRMSFREFEAWYLSHKQEIGRIHINGFVGISTSRQNDWCRIAAPGSAYAALADSVNIGGLIQDLCVEDWGMLLGALGSQIITNEVSTEFVLSKPMTSGGTVIVSINGVTVSSQNTRVDFQRNSVFLDGTVTPKVGDKVSVRYVAN